MNIFIGKNMSRFNPVQRTSSHRLINHGPTILITTRSKDGRHRNVMTAAWSTPVEMDPPRLTVLINKEAYTRELLLESGVFAVCVPSVSFINETYSIGHSTGREIDKFAKYGIETVQSPELGIPVIEKGCIAWLECRLIPEPHAQEKYDTFFGEVVSASADPEVFVNNHWQFTDQNKEKHSIHHLGGGNFYRCNDLMVAKEL